MTIRHNVLNISSIDAFINIKGEFNNSCKDVYFLRTIGKNTDLINDVLKMDRLLCERMLNGSSAYKRVGSLSKNISNEDITFYSDCFKRWIECGKSKINIRTELHSDEFDKILAAAFDKTIKLFDDGKNPNVSIQKNFVVKMMYWLDSILNGLLKQWDARFSIKIVACNICKRQEYLFFYLLTLIGFDVLLIQNENDISDIEEKLNLSEKIILGDYSKCDIPNFNPEIYKLPLTTSEFKQKNTYNDDAVQNNYVKIKLPERERCKVSSHSNTITADRGQQQENAKIKTFEELASLASSVVMIAVHDITGKVVATGSGIMIGKQGYILTNNHVASGGRFYSIRIEDDDKIYETNEMIKYNTVYDLAVIRIRRELMPLKMYQGSQKLARGQKVVAIGSPLGLFNSVSDGIISGFRNIRDIDMIQFTAPISNGSSGGAVLNMYGEVIGISTAGFDEGQNINLAVGYDFINTFIRGFT